MAGFFSKLLTDTLSRAKYDSYPLLEYVIDTNMASMIHILTVIICCYNSKQRIPDTLSRLSVQRIQKDVKWNLVIVDNASTDGTAEIAKAEWDRLGSPAPIRIVFEPEPGLAYARVAGLMATESPVVVFVDVDNWLADGFLERAYHVLINNPSIGAVGGQSVAIFEGRNPPDWFHRHAGSYAVGMQAQSTGDITSRGYLWGAGLAVRADVLRSILESGVRPLLVGRAGSKATAGDDSELCKWLILTGHKLHYDEKMQFSHFIPLERQSQKYLKRIHHGLANSTSVLSAYQAFIDRFRLLRQALSFRPPAIAAVVKNEVKILLLGWRVRNNLRILRSHVRRAPIVSDQ